MANLEKRQTWKIGPHITLVVLCGDPLAAELIGLGELIGPGELIGLGAGSGGGGPGGVRKFLPSQSGVWLQVFDPKWGPKKILVRCSWKFAAPLARLLLGTQNR